MLTEKDDIVQLGDPHTGENQGRVLTIKLQPKTGDAATDRNNRDADFQLRNLKEEWTQNGQDVLLGPTAWLPDAEWNPLKMRVYRIEAALKPGGAAGKNVQRIYLDHYLVLFTQNQSLVVEAMTGQDSPVPFRKQVEEILKTYRLAPSRPPTSG